MFLVVLETNCRDIAALEEFLRVTENIIDKHHYLCLIAKRYLIQLYQNADRKVRVLMDVVDVNKSVIITSAYIFLFMLLKHDFCYRFQSVKSF